jgi:sugar phosphate isomerase/epimerase
MCVHAVKAAAYAGCKILAVRPATIVRATQNAMEKSKAISLEVFDAMKEEADKVGVKLAFVNNTMSQTLWGGNFCYGSTAADLLELVERYDAGIVLDPVSAYNAMQRVEDLLIGVGNKLIGFLITDIEGTTKSPVLPTMGIINYAEIPSCLKKAPEKAALVVMQTPMLKRYVDFAGDEQMVEALNVFLRKTADVILEKSKMV